MKSKTPQIHGGAEQVNRIQTEIENRTADLKKDLERAIESLVQVGKDLPKEEFERRFHALNSDYRSKVRSAIKDLIDERKAEARSFNPFKAYQFAPKNWVRDMVITILIINLVVWGNLFWRLYR